MLRKVSASFRRYGDKDGGLRLAQVRLTHPTRPAGIDAGRQGLLVQDELAGGFETLPYITRKLLNHREIVRPPEADSGCDSLESHGDPSLRSGRDSFSRLLALAQFL